MSETGPTLEGKGAGHDPNCTATRTSAIRETIILSIHVTGSCRIRDGHRQCSLSVNRLDLFRFNPSSSHPISSELDRSDPSLLTSLLIPPSRLGSPPADPDLFFAGYEAFDLIVWSRAAALLKSAESGRRRTSEQQSKDPVTVSFQLRQPTSYEKRRMGKEVSHPVPLHTRRPALYFSLSSSRIRQKKGHSPPTSSIISATSRRPLPSTLPILLKIDRISTRVTSALHDHDPWRWMDDFTRRSLAVLTYYVLCTVQHNPTRTTARAGHRPCTSP